MTRYIPIKEAITLYEDKVLRLLSKDFSKNYYISKSYIFNKLIKIYEYNKIVFEENRLSSIFYDGSTGGDPLKKRNFITDILEKRNFIKGVWFEDHGLQQYFMKCFRDNDRITITGKLPLYGRSNDKRVSFYEKEYEKVYLDLFSLDYVGEKDSYNLHLFENYDYSTAYNLDTNYTVIGNKHTDHINFIDISVNQEDLFNIVNPNETEDEKLFSEMLLLFEDKYYYLEAISKLERLFEILEVKYPFKDGIKPFIPLEKLFNNENKVIVLKDFFKEDIELQLEYFHFLSAIRQSLDAFENSFTHEIDVEDASKEERAKMRNYIKIRIDNLICNDLYPNIIG